MRETPIGAYIGRLIVLQEARNLIEVAEDDLSNAVVLLWLSENSWTPEELGISINRLAASNVLGITVAGARPDESFTFLLETLSHLPIDRHIMTGVVNSTEIADSVEDFLLSTYPDERYFDEWNEYRIIEIGKSQQLIAAIKEVLKRHPK